MRKFLRNKSGQSLTEFALVLPILLVLIFGGIDALMTTNTQTRIDSFYNDIINTLISECPKANTVWVSQTSAHTWETNPSAIPAWQSSLVQKYAAIYSLDQKNFQWLSPNPLSTDMDSSKDFANPKGQNGAQQFRIFLYENDPVKGSYYRLAFKYKQKTITSYVFDQVYETRFNKEIYCKK